MGNSRWRKSIDPIKNFAEEKGLSVEQPSNFSDEETLEQCEADLIITAFVNVFVPAVARDTPRLCMLFMRVARRFWAVKALRPLAFFRDQVALCHSNFWKGESTGV